MGGQNTKTKHNWERWRFIWHGLFSLLTLLAWGAATVAAADPAWLPASAAAVGLGLWYGIAESRFGGRAFGRPLPAFLYFGLGWLLWFVAAAINGAFFLLLFVLFPYVFLRLPIVWAIVLAATLNGLVLLAIHRIDSELTATWMLILLGTTLGGGALALFIDAIIRQSEQRQRLIAELEAARETLARSEYEAGMLHERQRLAGELHDTIMQNLIAIVAHIQSAQATDDETHRRDRLQRAQTIARNGLAEARRFISMAEAEALSPELLEHRLRSLLTSWSRDTGIAGEFVCTGQVDDGIPHQTAHTLLRSAQEALNNVAKHANARRVTLTLSLTPTALLFDINDDGCGFQPAARPTGFGLINMRRRVEASGGTLSVESEPGGGTTIAIELALNHESAAGARVKP
ncbi:MAG: sensor histidine kinase [Aggregatilineales bacterium]